MQRQTQFHLEALEPRLLLSADGLAAGATPEVEELSPVVEMVVQAEAQDLSTQQDELTYSPEGSLSDLFEVPEEAAAPRSGCRGDCRDRLGRALFVHSAAERVCPIRGAHIRFSIDFGR